MTAVRCLRCGRPLSSARSRAREMGDRCARLDRQERAAVAAGFSPDQLAKARELIADGAIVPLRGRPGRWRVFRVVSSDGQRRYLTAPQACNCPAGLRNRCVCYHRVAATLLSANQTGRTQAP